MSDPRSDLVATVGAALLAEAGHSVQASEPADPPAWLAAARRYRVIGLLCDQGEAIGLPPEVRERLQQASKSIAMAGLARAVQTIQCVTALQSAGVRALVLKGVALSVQTTGSLTARDTRDIDVLIAPDDMPRAHEALLAVGAECPDRMYPGDSTAWQFARWACRESAYHFNGMIDVHWRIADEHGLLPDTDTLLSRAVTVDVAGKPLPTLNPSDALAAACVFAYHDRYRSPRYLVDIHRLLARGVQVPPDATPGLRRLVADTIGFAYELIPGWPVTALPALPDTGHAWREWEQVGGGLGVVRAYRATFAHSRRYSTALPSTARLLSILIVNPLAIDPDAGLSGFTRAIREKLRSLPRAGQGVGA